MKPNPPPDFNAGGWFRTGRIRIRTGWFGFARLEEEREFRDGARSWHTVRGHRIMTEERTWTSLN